MYQPTKWYQESPLRWGMFNAHDAKYDFDLPWMRASFALALATPFGLSIGMVATFLSAWLIIPILMVYAVVCWFVPVAGKLHPLGKIPRNIETTSSYGGRSTNPLRKLADRYWDMSDEDKRQFPHNILAVMSNPNLTQMQREDLAREMRKVFASIDERNEVRNRAVAQDVDISSALEFMRDQQRGIDIETRTYQELM